MSGGYHTDGERIAFALQDIAKALARLADAQEKAAETAAKQGEAATRLMDELAKKVSKA